MVKESVKFCTKNTLHQQVIKNVLMYNFSFHGLVMSCAEDGQCSHHSLGKCEEEGKEELAEMT
jgi:hypothetical protein